MNADNNANNTYSADNAADRLTQQLAFLLEIDALKQIIRRTLIIGGSRQENTAEHSWHVAMMAMVLAEHAGEPVDVLRVVKMLLIHDIVEIDAGDTYFFDTVATLDKSDREQLAATRLFGLLPPDQAAEFRSLWDEFEAKETAEARFATSLDRLMPLLHGYHTHGLSWQANGIQVEQVRTILDRIQPGSQTLWQYAETLINHAAAQGFFTPLTTP